MSATLPQRNITIFDGDPLQCTSFIRTFEHVEEKTSSYQDCLYFLEQCSRGLESLCKAAYNPQQEYQRAKNLLKAHFGNEYEIATACMDKVLGWPVVKGEDVQALQDMALFLRGYWNAMTQIQYMEELNIPSNMRQIVMKWPYKLQERWRLAACEIQDHIPR